MGIPEELFVNSSKIPIRFFCSICLDVCEDAVSTHCDHVFCKQCIEDLQTMKTSNKYECPNCRQSMYPIKPAEKIREFIAMQQVYCSERAEWRCGWTGKYALWHVHRSRDCNKASFQDKSYAKNHMLTSGLFYLTKKELTEMSIPQLKKILQIKLDEHKKEITIQQLENEYNFRNFLEKNEYVEAVFKLLHYGQKNILPYDKNELLLMPVRDLKNYLREHNINTSNIVEKSELVDLICKTQGIAHQYPSEQQASRAAFSPASHTGYNTSNTGNTSNTNNTNNTTNSNYNNNFNNNNYNDEMNILNNNNGNNNNTRSCLSFLFCCK